MSAMDQFRTVFFEECSDLLSAVEANLSRLEDGAYEAEDIHAIFRAVHSVKGGAGTFGFDNLVGFTHIFETSLDVLRNTSVTMTHDLVDLLLRANDILVTLVQNAEHGDPDSSPDNIDHVKQELEQFTHEYGTDDTTPSRATRKTQELSTQTPTKSSYIINFKPNLDIMRFGNEPFLILRELKNLSQDDSFHVRATIDRLPDLNAFNPEYCYLTWLIQFQSEAAQERIQECFEFVEDDCKVTIEHNAPTQTVPAIQSPKDISSPDTTPPSTPSTSPKKDTPKKAADTASNEHTAQSIRVDLDRIDRLVNTVGEMVIKQAMLLDAAVGLGVQSGQKSAYDHFTKGLEELSQHTRDLQESVMSIRAQPVKAVFSRMPRLVRELAGQLNKNVRIEMHGENTEIDKTVIERLGEPLTHMIRNAVDHGIEDEDTRIACGKDACGTIRLNAEHKSGRILIQIMDDGKGIPRETILKKAQEKGIIDAQHNLTGEEIDQLIFHPGFSTAQNVTNISGRGVGMDVVKRSIQDLGGRVHIQSVEGQGCTFNMMLPLTLAVMDGMIVRVGHEMYVVPLVHIVETLRPTAKQINTLISGDKILDLRARNVPVVTLAHAFNIDDATENLVDAVVVVVETEGGDNIGLVVDEIITQQQVVLKSLEANYDPVPGISAATILGNGQVSLILDINVLGQRDKHV